jgi:tetratricopeptide (TPR) repeat protein
MNPQEIDNQNDNPTKKLLVLGVALVLIVSLLGFYAYNNGLLSSIFGDKIFKVTKNQESSKQRLLRDNINYKEADDLFKKGMYNEALTKYQEAMDSADSIDIGQIDYKIGVSLLAQGKIKEGISELKRIAANEKYNSYVRAYAVHAMGNKFYESYDKNVTNEIFSTEPYSSMKVDGDVQQTYRKLFEYSSSMQPVALSELRIARWYAEQIASNALSNKKDINVENYTKLVNESLDRANKDLPRIQDYDKESMLNVLFLKASILSSLSIANIETESVDIAFNNAIQEATRVTDINSKMSITFNYALYLSKKFGESKKTEINNLLSSMINDPNFSKTPFNKILINERATKTIAHSNIILCAKFSKTFSDYLIKLGWKI